MNFIKPLAFLLAIPTLGYLISIWVLGVMDSDLLELEIVYSASEVCVAEFIVEFPAIKPFCEELKQVLWMKTGSILSAIVAVILLVSFKIFATISGKNRTRLVVIFPPLVIVTMIVLTFLVLIQGAILTYGIYIAEIYAIERVHFVVIGLIGLGALIGAGSLIVSLNQFVKKKSHSVIGIKLDQTKNTKLQELVKSVSDKLGARHPDHIIVGLEPNFYVTSADVNIIGETPKLEGETLYLSLPLARILSTEELKAIIGHELGHFRGNDTYYSMKFSPVYAGLAQAISSIESKSDEGTNFALLPTFAVLSYVMDVFHTNVSSINREREFEADKAASEVATPEALASSLLKIGLYAIEWHSLLDKFIERLRQGKRTLNLPILFASFVKYDVNEDALPDHISAIAQETISHPTDSHPPTIARIEELGLDIEKIEIDLLKIPERTCLELFDDARELEESLTATQEYLYKAMGLDVSDEDETSTAAIVVAAFGAHMVVADGKVEPEEIDQAEVIGVSLISEFDFIDFREFCHYPDSIPKLETLFEVSLNVSTEVKASIYDYLVKIANSDGDMSKEESSLLDTVKSEFEL
jgi:Zn-dependent protease with chaperone function